MQVVGRDEQARPRGKDQHPADSVSPRPGQVDRSAQRDEPRSEESRAMDVRPHDEQEQNGNHCRHAQPPVTGEHCDETDERQVHEALRPHVHRSDEEGNERRQQDDRQRCRAGASSPRE